MKNIALAILLASTAIAPTVLAVGITADAQAAPSRSTYTPRGLVDAAYSGRLDGVASFGTLEAKVLARDIEAEDLVKAAIAQGRLSEDSLTDRGFLNAVEAGLNDLVDQDN